MIARTPVYYLKFREAESDIWTTYCTMAGNIPFINYVISVFLGLMSSNTWECKRIQSSIFISTLLMLFLSKLLGSVQTVSYSFSTLQCFLVSSFPWIKLNLVVL